MKKKMIGVLGGLFLCSGCMATVSPGATVYTRYVDVAPEPTVIVDSAVVVDTAPVLITTDPFLSIPLFPLVVEHHRSVRPARVVEHHKPVRAPLVVAHHNPRPHVGRQPTPSSSHVSHSSRKGFHTSISRSHSVGKTSHSSHGSVSKSSSQKQPGGFGRKK